MLHELSREPRTASGLASVAGLSVQEAVRHLTRLHDLDLVAKGPDRVYNLTPIGELALEPLGDYGHLLAARDFYLHHDLRFVPPYLRLGPLLAAPRVQGLESELIVQMEELAARGRRRVLRAGSMTFPGFAPAPGGSPSEEWAGVFTPAAVLGERFLDLPERWGGAFPERVRVGLLPEVPFILAATEASGALFLRHRAGHLDFATVLLFEGACEARWVETLFRHVIGEATVAFDTRLGHAPDEWRARLVAAATRPAPASGAGLGVPSGPQVAAPGAGAARSVEGLPPAGGSSAPHS